MAAHDGVLQLVAGQPGVVEEDAAQGVPNLGLEDETLKCVTIKYSIDCKDSYYFLAHGSLTTLGAIARRDHVHRHCHLERLQAAGELGIAGARRPGDRREVAEASLALPGLDGLSAQAEIVVSVMQHEKRW